MRKGTKKIPAPTAHVLAYATMKRATSNYPDLNAALADTPANGTLLIDADTPLIASAIIPATMQIQWEGNTHISIAVGQTLTVLPSPHAWPLRELFIGVGATPGVSFAGNIGIEWVSPTWWGLRTGALDNSNAFNYASAALQAGSVGLRGGKIKIPRGLFYAANILLGPATIWEGSGIGATSFEGTTIKQLPNSNADVFVSNTVYAPDHSYLHQIQIRELRIIGDPTNTLGNGIHISCATGEMNRIDNVWVAAMPENGILFSGNGTNVQAAHLALHGNGKSGLRVDSSVAVSGLNLCHFNDISGDNNRISLIYIKPPGTPEMICSVRDVKAETSSGNLQPDIIVLDTLQGTPIHIENISAVVNFGHALNSFIRAIGSTSRIHGKGLRGGGQGTIINLVDDQWAGTRLPYLTNENVFNFTWAGGIPYDLDKGFRYIRNLFNGGVNVVTTSTYTMSLADENRLLVFDRPGPIAVIVPSPTTSGFTNGAFFPIMNIGAGSVTLTPNSGTINKMTTLVLTTGQGAQINSDGVNYYYWR